MKFIKITAAALVLSLFSPILSTEAWAKIGNIPSDLTKLIGAFAGKTSNRHQNVRAIIIPKAEKPGTFIVVALINNSSGIIFDGELISGSQNIGLSSLGLNQDGSEMEVTIPPTALMQVVYSGTNIADHIEITPQAGSQSMDESIILDKQASDVNFAAPTAGEYGTGANHVSVGQDGFVKVQATSLNITGQFMATTDIANVGVLRGVSFDANYQSRETDRVSGLIIGLVQGGKSAVLICSVNNNGKPVAVMMLKKK